MQVSVFATLTSALCDIPATQGRNRKLDRSQIPLRNDGRQCDINTCFLATANVQCPGVWMLSAVSTVRRVYVRYKSMSYGVMNLSGVQQCGFSHASTRCTHRSSRCEIRRRLHITSHWQIYTTANAGTISAVWRVSRDTLVICRLVRAYFSGEHCRHDELDIYAISIITAAFDQDNMEIADDGVVQNDPRAR